MRISKRLWLILVSIVSLLIGFLIYIVYRSENLLMFDWFKNLKIYNLVMKIRETITIPIPKWAIFSLPYALWNFSLGTSLIAIWYRKMNNLIKICIILLVLLMGVVIELLQGIHLIRGTFDMNDFILLFISAISIIIITFKIK